MALALLALVRFLNSLLLVALNGLGPIYVKVFANKIKDAKPHLASRLENEREFRVQVELFDKISLVVLLVSAILIFPAHWWTWLGIAAYLLIFDWALSHYLALHQPEGFLERLYPLFRPLYIWLRPLASGITALAKKGMLYDMSQEEEEEESPEEIDAFIQAGTEEGVIEEKDRHLVENILNLNETMVREIMTPRTEMKCLDIRRSKQEALEIFKTSRFSRLPVYRESIDNIEGLIRLKDLVLETKPHKSLAEISMPVLFVPESKNVADLLQEMLKTRIQMAVVLDEYGGTAGLITLEDAIEEIVGEIHDEHEVPDQDEMVVQPDGTTRVDGRVLLEDFCDHFGLSLVDDNVDTIGGYLFAKEGRIPDVGHRVVIQDVEIEILKADSRRIYEILVHSLKDAEPVLDPNTESNNGR